MLTRRRGEYREEAGLQEKIEEQVEERKRRIRSERVRERDVE